MTLRELLEKAEHDISTYKHPNITEVKQRLDELLLASGQGSIEHDTIEELTVDEDGVTIETSWFACGHRDTGTLFLPPSVIDAEDPIKAAKIFGLDEKIEKITRDLSDAESKVTMYSARLTKLNAEKEAAML
jgi:hypothetical protein